MHVVVANVLYHNISSKMSSCFAYSLEYDSTSMDSTMLSFYWFYAHPPWTLLSTLKCQGCSTATKVSIRGRDTVVEGSGQVLQSEEGHQGLDTPTHNFHSHREIYAVFICCGLLPNKLYTGYLWGYPWALLPPICEESWLELGTLCGHVFWLMNMCVCIALHRISDGKNCTGMLISLPTLLQAHQARLCFYGMVSTSEATRYSREDTA